MDNIVLLDTSVGSLNKGDEIIMKCVRAQLRDVTKNANVFTLPTHLSPFTPFQVARGSLRVQFYSKAKYKFVGGSNLLTMDMATHFPQWNVNIFNYRPLKGSILLGVGAGKGEKINLYTRYLYRKMLSRDYIHSVRDERTKRLVEEMGFRAINTGCPTIWLLTPDFCKHIPRNKSDSVIFTLTAHSGPREKDQELIDILIRNYRTVYFWVQGSEDYGYFKTFDNVEAVQIVPPSLEDYEEVLRTDVDYVGTRLHAGIYAMRHQKRSVIIEIDERAQGMSETYNLNTIARNELHRLEPYLHSDIVTNVNVDTAKVEMWLSQFTQ